jgi:hypothetical protein
MSSLTIEPVAKTDQPRMIATLVSAFIADPSSDGSTHNRSST